MTQKPEKGASERRAEDTVCGFHAVESSLARAPAEVLEVVIDRRRNDARAQRLLENLARADIPFRLAPREQLEQLSRGVKHQGVIARVRRRAPQDQSGLERLLDGLDRPPFLLILDCVQDPHNLGACLRTADGAGVDAVILPKDRACPVTPTVARVAAGAVQRLPVFYVANLVRTMESLQQRNIWITGGDATATRTLYEVDFTPATAIALGAESRGLRRLTRQHCDQLARIPMVGSVSSLNVSVAAGLFLFEVCRQRVAAVD